MTLEAARDLLRTLVEEGHECPVCTQFAKVYRRKIHASMAYTLIRMYREVTPGEYLYLPDLPQKSRDATGMAWWGLIAELQERREDGGRAGWWRVTPVGERWVRNEITVPKYRRIYDGRSLGPASAEVVSIIDALGKRFNYYELMAGG